MKWAAISISTAALAVTLAGCAGKSKHVATTRPVPPAATASAAPMPAGARPGMKIPTRLSDGSYLTPNRNLSAAASVWHLRAALNVAALACRGSAQAGIVSRYNNLLTQQKSAFAGAQTALAAEYRAAGGNWESREDDAMTRLYNYFSQDFAREGFCARAAQVLEHSEGMTPAVFSAGAGEQLAALDRPFVDFFRAYDAWRTGEATRPMIAVASRTATMAPAPVAVAPRRAEPPHLKVNMLALQDHMVTGG